MAWDTSDLTDYNDIIVQDGVFAYNFKASGTIYKGQAVGMVPGMNNTVMPCSNEAGPSDAVGLATMGASNGEWIAIAGPGNICNACCAAASAVGTALYGTTAGVLTATQGNATKAAGIVVSLPAIETTNYVGKVLLV